MTVGQLKTVLSSIQDEDAAVMIEYTPQPYEYITEFAVGVRIEDDTVTIMGITQLGDFE